MKIIYCLSTIRGIGGVPKVTIKKVNALAEIPGNEVFVIVTDNWKEHPLIDPLSEKVHFVNLSINYFESDYKSKFHLFLAYLKCFKHWVALQKQINKIKPDIIVSVSSFEKYIIPFLRTSAVKIRELHLCSNYRSYLYSSKWLVKLLDFIDYKIGAIGFDKIILLTKEDKDTFYKNSKKYTYVHNISTSITLSSKNVRRKQNVISVGRLSPQKDFTSLIRVWSKVCKEIKDWDLYILGEGVERNKIEREIQKMHLSDRVYLPGFSSEIAKIMSESKIFVLTSLYEGFGLVITEAMNAGLPVVSYDFQFGPRDIITDGKDGYIIENRDESVMADRIIDLIKNQDKLSEMSKAAYNKAKNFSESVIIQKWMNLFHSEVAKKRKN